MRGRTIFALLIAEVGRIFAVQTGGTANMNQLQPAADKELANIDMRVSDFMAEVINRRADTAIDTLLMGSPLARDEKKLSQLKTQIKQGELRYGEYLRQEKMQLEWISISMIRSVRVMHCRRYPVIWRMTFYRSSPTGEWVLVSLKYDTNYDSLPAAEPQMCGSRSSLKGHFEGCHGLPPLAE